MRTESEAIRLQAEEHPLVPTTEFNSIEEYVLYLVHLVAYEAAAKLASDRVVLDIGCNVGYGTALVGKESREAIGVDVSPSSVQAANERNAASNIRFQTIDGLQLPFGDATFDLVVSFQVIEHIFAPDSYLREIRRVLKPGGTVILTTPNAAIRLYDGMKPWNRFHVREYKALELEDLLKNWFPSVEVKGLFAKPELYDVECRRAHRAREAARRQTILESHASYRLKRMLIGIAKRVLPPILLNGARRVARRGPSPHAPGVTPDRSFLSKYSTADFYYQNTDLDSSLDLMAVCHSSAEAI